jgi:hypothetical protein
MEQKRVEKSDTGQGPRTQQSMYLAARELTRAMHVTAPENQKNSFAIKGSMALMMHGINVMPNDIDISVENIPHAQQALTQMGYPKQNLAMQQHVQQRGNLPSLDVLHGPDWGDNLNDTRLIAGVRVKSREALMQDLRIDKRPEKAKRNEFALQALSEQAEREKSMQMVLYTGQK